MSAPETVIDYATVSDGATIAFRRFGVPGKPRIVLIHSLALDATVWDGVVDLLSNQAEILTIDCRGHGRSSRPPGPYTVERFGDDVAELLDRLEWQRVVVAGCSMGGCVAQAFAARHPQYVSAMALIDTTAWYGPEAPREWRARAAKARVDGLESMAAFQVTRWFGDRFRLDQAERVQHTMDVFVHNDIDAYEATCAMLGDADLRPHLAEFRFPVAVVVGEEDYATPVENARALAESIPQASVTVLPNARHLTPIERPEDIAAAIEGLMSKAVI